MSVILMHDTIKNIESKNRQDILVYLQNNFDIVKENAQCNRNGAKYYLLKSKE
ncbi:hypothetical protein HYO65_gp222 [Tenacibaculum phage PTm1]|uniref:Uncharacterized protein n=2 Tax=Shirahamavirus PTm1 TaxID=2846435 RepID=A0A5S9EQM2_9CAUD|nr:hypothetical protein HYO65_gp222 [Tenacibaculum phage PTm1]BBI90614.1 hypothetical protein [Tenacibaculum phage PTm1]BBI90920.1 hypothetical protein [Tenacibaculum phage PTm5]